MMFCFLLDYKALEYFKHCLINYRKKLLLWHIRMVIKNLYNPEKSHWCFTLELTDGLLLPPDLEFNIVTWLKPGPEHELNLDKSFGLF